MSKRKRFLCAAILLLAAALALVFLWPLHPLEQHADKTFILSRYHAAVYSSAPYQYWKLEPGTEGHAQLLSLAQEYPAHYAPWKALSDLPAAAPWQQKPGQISGDVLWNFFIFDTNAGETSILTLDGGTLRTTGAAVYRIDPAFADALWDFVGSLDESYGYTPLDGGGLSIPE